MPQRKPKIYIAGPITQGDQLANVSAAMKVWSALHKAGFTPICPHWSAIQHLHNPELSHADWLEYDFEILSGCDALLRMPGASDGADAEVFKAMQLDLWAFFYGEGTIYPSLESVITAMKEELIERPASV